jgi:hypothetical protein
MSLSRNSIDDSADPFGSLVFDPSAATFPKAPGQRSSIRRPSQYASPTRKASLAATFSGSTRQSTVEATQTHPTALPNEFLALIRTFRITVESALGTASVEQQEELRVLQQVCSQIVRFVTSFLIQKYEDQAEYERKKLLGWSGAEGTPAAAPRNISLAPPNADIVGPFLLSALYVVAESLLHLLKCDRCYIFMPEGTKLKAVVCVGASAVAAPLFYDASHGSCGVVYSSGVAVNIADAERAPPQLFSRHSDELSKRGYYVRNVLCFPLMLPQDEPTALGPPQVRGVVAAYNKVKNSIYPAGFTNEDEESMHHYALLIATILKWGSRVEFCSNTSQEESSRLQQLILVNRFTDPLAARRTTGGTSTQTRLEANMRMRKQKDVETSKEREDEEGLIVQHPAMRMTFRASSIIRTRIYRTPAASSPLSGSETKTEAPQSFILSEAAQVVATGGNMRELMLMLDQADTSWKTSRQECAALRDRISKLEASLMVERKRRFEAEQLCRTCGITLPVPSANEEAIRLAIPEELPQEDSARSPPGGKLQAPLDPPPQRETYEEVASRIATAQQQQHTSDRKVLDELAKLERGFGLLLDDKVGSDLNECSLPAMLPQRTPPASARTPSAQKTQPALATADLSRLINRLTGNAPAPQPKKTRGK